MIDEADRKRKLVREVNALPDGYALRIEHRWAVGILDLVIKIPGFPLFWAEGKMVEGNVFSPTARQWEEGLRIQRTGMRALLFGWKQSTMFISSWTKQADIRNCAYGSPPWLSVLQGYLKLKEGPHESR